GGVTEMLCAVGVPAAEGGEENLLFAETEVVDAELIGTGIRLEGVIHFGAEKFVKESGNACVFRVGAEHGRAEVCDGDDANAGGLELLQGFHGIGPRLQVKIRIEEPLAVVR